MKRILWVDDEGAIIDSSIELFREKGFHILKATTVTRALTILRNEKVDGVLLDVNLGAEDGLELLRDIHQRYPTLTVAVFTGFPDHLDQILARRFGASAYFHKIKTIEKLLPVDPEQLDRFFAALHEVFEEKTETFKKDPEAIIARPLSVFCSYSHKDAKLRAQLDDHLSNLKRQQLISVWHDRDISAGTDWVDQINEHLNTADIILLLVSASFIASDYCYSVEMKRALERHERGEARVIPVILRWADWESAPFGKLQALPSDGRPVTKWSDREEAFMNVAQGIRKAVNEMSASGNFPRA